MNHFLEKDLEDIIMNNMEEVNRRNFPKLFKKSFRQFRLSCGKIIDIFSCSRGDGEIRFKVVELKRGEASGSAIIQAVEYCYEVINESLQSSYHKIDFEIIVVASRFSPDAKNYLRIIPSLSLYTYNYLLDGISFHKVDLQKD